MEISVNRFILTNDSRKIFYELIIDTSFQCIYVGGGGVPGLLRLSGIFLVRAKVFKVVCPPFLMK